MPLLFNDVAGDLSKFKAQAALAYKFELGSVKPNVVLLLNIIKAIINGALLGPGIDPTDPYLRQLADGINFFNTSIGLYGEQNGKLKFGIIF